MGMQPTIRVAVLFLGVLLKQLDRSDGRTRATNFSKKKERRLLSKGQDGVHYSVCLLASAAGRHEDNLCNSTRGREGGGG